MLHKMCPGSHVSGSGWISSCRPPVPLWAPPHPGNRVMPMAWKGGPCHLSGSSSTGVSSERAPHGRSSLSSSWSWLGSSGGGEMFRTEPSWDQTEGGVRWQGPQTREGCVVKQGPRSQHLWKESRAPPLRLPSQAERVRAQEAPGTALTPSKSVHKGDAVTSTLDSRQGLRKSDRITLHGIQQSHCQRRHQENCKQDTNTCVHPL